MLFETRRTCGSVVTLWALLALGQLAVMPALAQVQPAREPIVTTRLLSLVDSIPGSATDLPPTLAAPQDVYLLVTAGGGYTTVQVLANPGVPPPKVAAALASALAGTPCSGAPVEWSADAYSAAQAQVHQSHFGKVQGSETVPLRLLLSGLRRAGFSPHLLLRIPRYAQSSLPSSGYGTRSFLWYDSQRLSRRTSVTVTTRLGWPDLDRLLTSLVLFPLAGALGLRLAGFWSGRGTPNTRKQRLLFRRVSTFSILGAWAAQIIAYVFLLKTPILAVLSDLWLGSNSTSLFSVLLTLGILPLPLLLMTIPRETIRRFGPLETGPPVPMSDEEKAARKRIAQWSLAPHLLGALILGAVPFFISRTNPIYAYVHPVAAFLPAVGAALVASVLRKRLDKFTQRTPDDALTWQAQQLGKTLGVRIPDVTVEDSSRAAVSSYAAHQGHHITLSRKLRETFTPAETEFILAHHLASMKRRTTAGSRWVLSLLCLPLLVPIFFILSPQLLPGPSPLTAAVLSPWFLPGLLAYLGAVVVVTVIRSGSSVQRQAKQDTDADREALNVTGDLAAAESALAKLDLLPATLAAGAYNPALARNTEMMQRGRLKTRRTELKKAALTLPHAPVSEERFKTKPGTPTIR